MLEIRLTSKAVNDLVSIGRYTQKTWSVEQRDLYLDAIDIRLKWLAENPQLGKVRDDIKKGYLSYHEGRHIIFYILTDTTIDIIGILHESMDIESHV